MREMTCKNCGGRINPSTMRCEYCGTQYARENNVLRIETYTQKVDVLESRIVCPEYLFLKEDPEGITEHVVKQLCRSFAEQLLPYMDIRDHYDPCRMERTMKAYLRVARPNTKF